MKRRISIAALLLVFAGELSAQSSDNVLAAHATLKNANGETVFRTICQGCHMPDAKGATGAGTYPALAGNSRLISPQYMAAVILFGRHDMPSFAMKPSRHSFYKSATLSDEQIASVINYVRTHFGNHYTDRITASAVASMHAAATLAPRP